MAVPGPRFKVYWHSLWTRRAWVQQILIRSSILQSAGAHFLRSVVPEHVKMQEAEHGVFAFVSSISRSISAVAGDETDLSLCSPMMNLEWPCPQNMQLLVYQQSFSPRPSPRCWEALLSRTALASAAFVLQACKLVCCRPRTDANAIDSVAMRSNKHQVWYDRCLATSL